MIDLYSIDRLVGNLTKAISINLLNHEIFIHLCNSNIHAIIQLETLTLGIDIVTLTVQINSNNVLDFIGIFINGTIYVLYININILLKLG